MDVTVILDHKFGINPEGNIVAETMFGNSFWSRYLTVFDKVRVICRAKKIQNGEVEVIANDRLEFCPVPYYEGPAQFAKNYFTIMSSLKSSLPASGAVILRVPQILPSFAQQIIVKRGLNYGVEVVGDPWDVYAPGAERNLFRPFFRRYFTSRLKRICKRATASSYVTESALQKRYPPSPGSFTTHASSVEISDVISQPRERSDFIGGPFRLLFVGALNRLYKGQDILLKSISQLIKSGLQIRLTFVGDGQYRTYLEELAESLGIAKFVHFIGSLPHGNAVFSQMDKAQLFVLPSRQEGLARSAIESISRGLPVVASSVGGMSEIVPGDCLVKPNSVESLTEKLKKLMQDPDRLSELSRFGLEKARGFLREELQPRRQSFYRSVRDSASNR